MDPKPKPGARARYRGFESILVPIVVRVGGVTLSFEELSGLADGSVLKLDLPVGAPFELIAGGDSIGRVEPIASDGEDGVALKLVTQPGEEKDDDSAP